MRILQIISSVMITWALGQVPLFMAFPTYPLETRRQRLLRTETRPERIARKECEMKEHYERLAARNRANMVARARKDSRNKPFVIHDTTVYARNAQQAERVYRKYHDALSSQPDQRTDYHYPR